MGPKLPGDDNYASIDPAALKGAANDLQKAVDGVHSYVGGLRSDFQYFGIDTGKLATLDKVASVIEPLIGQLRKRQSMAEQLVAQHPENGKVAYFQGDLLGQFKTVAAAKAQAHIDAQKIKDAAAHGDGVPDDVYKDLQKYGNDPDYAAAFVTELGPKTTAYLLFDAEHFESDRKPDQGHLQALSTVFSTASYRVNFDDKYLADLGEGAGDLGVGIDPLEIFTPLLRSGTWSTKSLENIADNAFWGPVYNHGPIGMLGSQTVDNIFRGLANNPIAAADYYSKHQQDMYDLGNSKLPVQPTISYIDFLHAATIDARSVYATWQLSDPSVKNLAESNANFVVNHVGKDGDQSHGLLETTYAQIGSEYLDDFVKTLSSPVDVSGTNAPWLAVNASEDAWKKFFTAGMASDEGLLILTGAFQDKVGQLNDQLNTDVAQGQHAGTNTTPYLDPERATAWLRYARNELQTDFKSSLDAADDQVNKDYQDRVDGISSLVGKGLDWITDPKGIPEDLASMGEDAVKDWVGGKITDLIAGEKPELPSAKIHIDDTGLDGRSDYANDAISQYNKGLELDPKHPWQGSYNDGDIHWDGKTDIYNDPHHPFVNSDGTIKPISEIKKDPTALKSFIDWLQDPNVQSHVAANDGRPN